MDSTVLMLVVGVLVLGLGGGVVLYFAENYTWADLKESFMSHLRAAPSLPVSSSED